MNRDNPQPSSKDILINNKMSMNAVQRLNVGRAISYNYKALFDELCSEVNSAMRNERTVKF